MIRFINDVPCKVDDEHTYYMPVSRELLEQMRHDWGPTVQMKSVQYEGEWTLQVRRVDLPDFPDYEAAALTWAYKDK